MVAAIGSSLLPGSYGTGADGSMANLEAQLAKYQRELSNCVNCDSANTAKGKETIQAISNEISSIKARIEAMENAKPATHDATSITHANTLDAQVAQPEKSADRPIGRLVDAYA